MERREWIGLPHGEDQKGFSETSLGAVDHWKVTNLALEPIGASRTDLQGFSDDRADAVSNNSARVDRKNLLAAWNWGVAKLKFRKNPMADTEEYSHE